MTGILTGIWFLLYGLMGVGVNIPSGDIVLAVLALIIGVLFLIGLVGRG